MKSFYLIILGTVLLCCTLIFRYVTGTEPSAILLSFGLILGGIFSLIAVFMTEIVGKGARE